MALTLSAARKLIRFFSRNAGDPTDYATYMVDFAFRRAANYLIRDAHLCLRTDSQDTVAAQTAYTVAQTTFRCDRLDSVYLSGTNVVVDSVGTWSGDYAFRQADFIRGGEVGDYNYRQTARLAIVDYTDLNDFLISNQDNAQPRMVAFSSDGSYSLWPVPDQVYTVNCRWSDFFTTWNLGTPLTSFTNTAGVLSAVVVIDPSDNLGASLSASFSDSGSGSGATATATVTNGALASVAVGGAGGSNYSSATQLLLGGYNSQDITFNLPDDLLDEVLSLGAPAFLQFNDPERAFATAKGQEFRAFIEKTKSLIGGLGIKRIIRR